MTMDHLSNLLFQLALLQPSYQFSVQANFIVTCFFGRFAAAELELFRFILNAETRVKLKLAYWLGVSVGIRI